MSGLEDLKKRVQFQGGGAQQDRMIADKLRTLKKALLYSYQSCTVVLPDGREFRSIIEPDKLKPDYDNMLLSIPFEDVCLNAPMIGTTTEGTVPTNIKEGDVFQWKDNGTYWIVYLRYLREKAYFRAEIRRCDYEVEINGHKYHIYFQGPVETKIMWNQKGGVEWNDLNYSATLYITKNEETLNFFHRFTEIKIDGKNYQVAVVNSVRGDGILQVNLKEYFENTIKEEGYHEPEPVEIPNSGPRIIGNSVVKPYDIVTFVGADLPEGSWKIDNSKKAKFVSQEGDSITIEIITGKSGFFNLSYIDENEEEIVNLPITIDSL